MTGQTQRNIYLDKNFDRFVAQLSEWLAIPSISTLSENREDVRRAAEWVEKRLLEIGFAEPRIVPTAGHPLVYAEWHIDDRQPTLLLYGHYDVQPVDPLAEWLSPPFEPTVRDGNIYCRGACDDKGQVMIVLAALEAWVKTEGTLPVNVKILLEGEEEAGGDSIAEYVRKNPNLLKADAVLICDTHMVSPEQPSLVTGLRGILYTEITVTGAKTDLHSGSYGGVAPNPLHAICVLISRLKGEDGVIAIPELAANIPIPSATEKQFWLRDSLHIEAALHAEMGVEHCVGEKNYPALERIGLRPTLEVHGIKGGFTGEGAKTVIPAQATAKVSMRLPANLDPHTVFGWLEKAVSTDMPNGYRVRITNLHAGKGVAINPDNPFIRAAADALAAEYGVQPIFMREGGSIPIAALFAEVLRIPLVLMGFGLPDDTVHAPNEKFSLSQFRKGMKTVADYLARIRNSGI
ncbi:MAG: peptidase M20 [Desulfobulbaceae bacterium BRH_c16a]|nr:MAG: peptidase M20 [Desulfobulbaceae bacterium BRH_c16a]